MFVVHSTGGDASSEVSKGDSECAKYLEGQEVMITMQEEEKSVQGPGVKEHGIFNDSQVARAKIICRGRGGR